MYHRSEYIKTVELCKQTSKMRLVILPYLVTPLFFLGVFCTAVRLGRVVCFFAGPGGVVTFLVGGLLGVLGESTGMPEDLTGEVTGLGILDLPGTCVGDRGGDGGLDASRPLSISHFICRRRNLPPLIGRLSSEVWLSMDSGPSSCSDAVVILEPWIKL